MGCGGTARVGWGGVGCGVLRCVAVRVGGGVGVGWGGVGVRVGWQWGWRWGSSVLWWCGFGWDET